MVRGVEDGRSTDGLDALGVTLVHVENIENLTYVVNQGDGHQLIQQSGDRSQQQGNLVGGDQSGARQSATQGNRSSDSRKGWLLIGVAVLLATVSVGLGIADVVPWMAAGPVAVAILAVAAVVRFN